MEMPPSLDIREYFDIKVFKAHLEVVCRASGRAILVIDLDGKEVIACGRLPRYLEFLQKKTAALAAYQESSRAALKKICDTPEGVLYHHAPDGLVQLWAPILISEKLIGAIGCIGLCDSPPDTKTIKKFLASWGENPHDILTLLDEIKIQSPKDIEHISSLLFITAQTLPPLMATYTQAKTELADIKLLYELSKRMLSTLTIDTIINEVIKLIMQHYAVYNCSLILLEEKAIQKRCCYLDNEHLQEFEKNIIPDLYAGKHILTISIKDDKRFTALSHKIISEKVVCFPLTVQGDLIGAIIIYVNTPNSLSNRALTFFSALGETVAPALFNLYVLKYAQESAHIDKLTGLYNRRYFNNALADYLAKTSSQKPCSVALIDIDDFKGYNDTHGHLKGDQLLTALSSLLLQKKNSRDVIGRYGGEEFIIIMHGLQFEEAHNHLESIRKTIEQTAFFGGEYQPHGKVTMSAGMITCADNSLTPQQILERVDKLLYKSKANGKNMVSSVLILGGRLPDVEMGT